MNRKAWYCISICLIVITFVESVILLLLLVNPNITATEISLENEVLSFQIGGIQPDCGYIPDSKTAARVGGTIIDQIFEDEGRTVLPWERGKTTAIVEYDPTLRLWKISKGYFLRGGAYIIIEQDTGAVINTWFTK